MTIDPEFPLPGFYIRQIAEQMTASGGDVERWLAGNGLSRDRLDDPSLKIPFPLLRQLIRDALAITGEPALGLLVGERLAAHAHGVLSYAVMSAATLRQAIEVLEHYLPVRTALIAANHEVRDGELVAEYDEVLPLGDIGRPVTEAITLTFAKLMNTIGAGTVRVQRVLFPFPKPAYHALAEDLFGCEILYGQRRAGLALPAEAIDRPLKMADPAAFEEAAAICRRELERLAANSSTAARVRRLLVEANGGFPSLNVTARLLCLTPRTLHRRLIEEGTSFRAILDDVRHRVAAEHLRAGRMSVTEIAYLTGYTDLANFRRAFRRWSGQTPSEFREAAAGS
ncbi:AraC family transcriptional regulator [Zavarzinia sp.]|uniref:AraC family transcriptional regulator n=1 Tax=Zavarzinia sp. TaxID=2027920 RepID=UPI003568F417